MSEMSDAIYRLSKLPEPQPDPRDAEIERLRAPFRAVDAQDWDYIMSAVGWGGRARF